MTCNEMALMANIAVDMQKNEVNDVLDKIKADIEQILTYDQFTGESYSAYEFKSDVLEIIDKYRAEEK